MGNELTDLIVDLLRVQPNLSAPEIAEALAEPGVNRSVVNRLLYAEWAVFEQIGSTSPPRWTLKADGSAVHADAAESSPPTAITPDRAPRSLRSWQRRAHAEWMRRGRNGIIEAVGGTGKTTLGVQVVAEAVASSIPAVVVVADDSIRAQWLDELAEATPECRVAGLSSNPRQGGERTWQVAIVTASTVTRLRQIASPEQCSNALLVVDDLDRYGGGVFAQLLTAQFTGRLALTRALDREDQTVRSRLLPYFGPVINGCDYPTAHTQKLLPPITVVQVGVELDAKERTRLTHLDSLVDREYDTLIDNYGAPGESAEFRTFVDVLAAGRGSGAHHANRYLAAAADRATLLAECRAKTDLVSALPANVLTATQSVFFTERPVSASQVHRALRSQGIPAATTATTLTAAQRTAVADGLRDRTVAALVEQRALDPTITVPAAEIAVLLARHRNRTQLIHRLGRVIRPGGHVRRQLVVNVFVSGSVEDPSRDRASVAASIGSLATETVRTDPAGLIAFLETWQKPARRSPAASPTSSPQRVVATEPEPDHRENRPPLRQPEPKPRPPVAPAKNSVPAPTFERVSSPLPGSRPEPVAVISTPEIPAPAIADLLTELTNLGQIATGEEVGDLIGYTDPGELRMLAEVAANDELLVFAEVGGDSDDLLLLGTARQADLRSMRAAAARITLWANTSEDPIGAMYELMSDLEGVPVPPHRLVQIAAFLRGSTPKALL
ncbi:DEAD/DEAH box helicase family protein [Nocardia asteroides]|uniref:DEAD/DEAH box helicase family protein n=1 Tax=Nocardia asteroides TaxID=1824 RepID=UPI001E33F517|nr:DEAD/DEAH box helicase family protein [Nocardia asteroides]UGT54422.1 DEAD/DEAH box helicase family protein [Nocardia asteroides]